MPDQKSRNLDSHNGKSRYVDASRRVRVEEHKGEEEFEQKNTSRRVRRGVRIGQLENILKGKN